MKEKKQPGGTGIWTGSILAAFLVAIGIFVVLLQTEKKVLGAYEKAGIYVALQEIPKGMLLTPDNYEDYIVLKELDKTCIPETALKFPEQIDGLIAGERIEAGVLLTTGMFERQQELTAHMQEPVIAGFKAEDLYQVVGGVLRAGDRIHIYMVTETGQAHLVWENVYVQQVFDSGGSAIQAGNTSTAAQRMNVFLDAADVDRFYTELAQGTLRVVKVCDK